METLHMLDAFPKTKDQIHYQQFINRKIFLAPNISPGIKYIDILIHAKINLCTSTHIETRR